MLLSQSVHKINNLLSQRVQVLYHLIVRIDQSVLFHYLQFTEHSTIFITYIKCHAILSTTYYEIRY